ncbi:DUF357 domain-containing protein, partial [Candidatus Woesearchaeota archaeon]|nr:DUF357 domain-containing protein [Candidatus Woesearchaeota archaeon]
KAISVVKILPKKSSQLYRIAEDFLSMAKNYLADAKHFRDKGDYVTAFAAVSYAHAWLDAGARMKIFDTGKEAGNLFASD